MATRKRVRATGTSRKNEGAEYRFKIDAFTPETMPLARLAEYLKELAAILGEPKSVHLVRLEKGSTVLVHEIEREAIPKVRDRAIAVRRGDAPRDALQAYRTINKYLREDNGHGSLQDKKGGTPILFFPGVEEAEERFPPIRQEGTIDGEIVRVGGTDEKIPVLLQFEDQLISGCWAERSVAKQLAEYLFEPVRLHGRGKWSRDSEGVWDLESFKIERFEKLDSAPLGTALAKLRLIGGEWRKGAYGELEEIRHGQTGKRHGGR